VGRKYFGTDGVRGTVGQFPIRPDFVLKLGWAAGRVLSRSNGRKGGSVVIGKDTRISGYMFESALEAGLSAAGLDIQLLGPMSTPGIAYLTRTLRADAGIVISASHNPFEDNGIKFFSSEGTKLPDDIELAIEEELEKDMVMVDSACLGKAERVVDARGRYIEFCKSTVPLGVSLKGLKIVLDCAHGATYHVAPAVFSELGAEVVKLGTEPDGLNINLKVGSTHPETVRKAVLDHKADLGISFDGDGDRVIMVDSAGEILDGDELLYIIARERQSSTDVAGVVGTQMSNLGLEQALAAAGIAFERAKVGDRYVMERLRARGWCLGGESSGHIICLDRTTTGDGIVSALQVLMAMVREGLALRQLAAGMTKYPQHMVNVRLDGMFDIDQSPSIRRGVEAVEKELGDSGRVLLRPSGTEPLVRVMVEGRDGERVRQLAEELAGVVSDAVSAKSEAS